MKRLERYHGEHEPIVLKRPPKSQRIWFLVCTIAALAIVIVGWALTAFQDIKGEALRAKAEVRDSVSTVQQIKVDTTESRQQIEASTQEIRGFFDAFVGGAKQQDAIMEAVANDVRQTIEADAAAQVEEESPNEESIELE